MLTTAQLAAQTTYTGLSVFFERAGYYGMRSVLLLYLVGNTIRMEQGDAVFTYTIFITAFTLARPIGGIITDLLTGVKLSAIIGLSMMAMGCFTLMFGHIVTPYVGIFLLAIGNGLYAPANIAHMLRIYEGRESKTDGGLSIQYSMITLGSFVGPLLIGFIVDIDNFKLAFLSSAILLLCGMVFTIFYKEQPIRNQQKPSFSTGFKSFAIIGIIVGCIVYWFAHSSASNNLRSSLQADYNYWATLIPVIIGLFICILFSVLWYFIDIRSAWKWTFGAFITGIGILLGLLFSENSSIPTPLFLVAVFLLSLGEILFAVYWFSLVKRFANPKYLCTIIGCALGISTYCSGYLTGLFEEKYHNGFLASFLGMVALILLAIISLILTLVFKKQELKTTPDEYPIADNSLIDQ